MSFFALFYCDKPSPTSKKSIKVVTLSDFIIKKPRSQSAVIKCSYHCLFMRI